MYFLFSRAAIIYPNDKTTQTFETRFIILYPNNSLFLIYRQPMYIFRCQIKLHIFLSEWSITDRRMPTACEMMSRLVHGPGSMKRYRAWGRKPAYIWMAQIEWNGISVSVSCLVCNNTHILFHVMYSSFFFPPSSWLYRLFVVDGMLYESKVKISRPSPRETLDKRPLDRDPYRS